VTAVSASPRVRTASSPHTPSCEYEGVASDLGAADPLRSITDGDDVDGGTDLLQTADNHSVAPDTGSPHASLARKRLRQTTAMPLAVGPSSDASTSSSSGLSAVRSATRGTPPQASPTGRSARHVRRLSSRLAGRTHRSRPRCQSASLGHAELQDHCQ
jgi:hypothetical protein